MGVEYISFQGSIVTIRMLRKIHNLQFEVRPEDRNKMEVRVYCWAGLSLQENW